MKILAHRGYWNKSIKKNSADAIKQALKNGFGFESDIRDYNGNLVISHDMPSSSSQSAEEIFKWLQKYNDEYCFAINIKADGLKNILQILLSRYSISNYFLFDMSIPQMVEFKEMGFRFFTRQSEIEPLPCMYADATGIWIDGFWSVDWITERLIDSHLKEGKEVCLVSPELHGFSNYVLFWRLLSSFKVDFDKIYLCTDYPEEARVFFHEKD